MKTRFRSLVVAALAVALAPALAACGGDDEADGSGAGNGSAPLSGEAPVRIVNFEFKPKKVTVTAGTKVVWTNEDTQIHDIKDTSPLATPVSPPMNKGETFSITYAQPGSYSYVCGIHPYMTGSVEVVPSAGGA